MFEGCYVTDVGLLVGLKGCRETNSDFDKGRNWLKVPVNLINCDIVLVRISGSDFMRWDL